jgi:hypothetical protein
MRTRILLPIVCLVALLGATGTASAQTDPAAPTGPADNGDFQIEFGSFKKANRSAATLIRRSKAMESVAAEVNGRWALPGDISVYFSDDIDVGPAFIPQLKLDDGTTLTFINFPGSFLTQELKAMRVELKGVDSISPTEATVAATQFVLAHEIGHALVNQLKLPVTGKEEDAVDGFAAYLLADNPKFGPLTAFSAALFFDALAASRGELTDSDFADEHSILQQRTYQFLCWVYGSDRKRFKALVGPGLLPKARAVRCGDEWKQVKTSWDTLLGPYALASAA